MFYIDPENEILADKESGSQGIPLKEIDVELLKLKAEYQMKKLFSIEHNDLTKAELATLRFKILMIESGVKTND